VKHIIQFEKHEIESDPNLTILDNLEAKNIKSPYQCREGYCGACCVKLICGQVEYIEEPMAFCDDDEILPCVCKAISDITIKRI